MALGEAIKLRLNQDKRYQYEEEAAARGLSLPAYLRMRLEEGDRINENLASLRIMMLDGFSSIESALNNGKHSQVSDKRFDYGLMVEAVLSLRTILKPMDMKMIHSELKRQGIGVWTGK